MRAAAKWMSVRRLTFQNSYIQWGRLGPVVARFTSVQLVVQILNACTGILIVRTLVRPEYALFIIVNTMQTALNLLADLGIHIGVTSIGGQIWNDRLAFSRLIYTAMALRRKLAFFAVAVSLPVMFVLLIRAGASWPYALLISGVVLAAFGSMVGILIEGLVPRLHSQYRQIQNVDLLGAGARFLLVGSVVFIHFNAAIAAGIGTISFGLQRWLVRRQASKFIDIRAEPDARYRKDLVRFVKTQALQIVFFCIQGQMNIWIISIFGSKERIAEVGALSRLGVIFAIMGSVLNGIAMPAFARAKTMSHLKRQIFTTLLLYVAFAALLILVSWRLPREVLWILGGKYGHLRGEVLLMVVSSVVFGLVTIVWSLNTARGWVSYTWIIVPATLAVQFGLVFLLNLSTVSGAILFQLYSVLPNLIVMSAMTIYGFRNHPAGLPASS
jgi:O-antigen/teichoic acid export membrane protein